MENNFENFYNNISPRLKKYEILRYFLLALLILLEIGVVVFMYFIVTTTYDFPVEKARCLKHIFTIVIFASWLHFFIKKQFEMRVKKKIIEEFCDCFENYDWQEWMIGESYLDEKTLRETKILPKFTQRYSDDNFSGLYKGLPVVITEQRLDCGGSGIYAARVFEGLVIGYAFEETFPAEIIVRDGNILPPANLEKVTLEDTEFNKMFNVYSNDQIECRFILTTSFMEKLKTLKTLFNAKHVSASFVEDKLYIAADIRKDSFNIANLFKPVNNRKDFEIMYNQFEFILKIADLLKLTDRI